MTDYSALLPATVIASMLGIPPEQHDDVRVWTDDIPAPGGRRRRHPSAAIEAQGKLVVLSAEVAAARRAHPSEDLLSLLVQVEFEGRPLTDAEIIGMCILLISGGHETTAKLIANGVRLFATHPDQRAELVDRDHADGRRRWRSCSATPSPTQYMARTTTRPVELHGTTIPAGEKVLLLLGSGNRDPREFERPDVFDVHRPNTRILALGHGAHVCLGAAVVRLEARVALEEFLARYPEYDGRRVGRGVHALRQRAGALRCRCVCRSPSGSAGDRVTGAARRLVGTRGATRRGPPAPHRSRPLRRRPAADGHAARRVRAQPPSPTAPPARSTSPTPAPHPACASCAPPPTSTAWSATCGRSAPRTWPRRTTRRWRATRCAWSGEPVALVVADDPGARRGRVRAGRTWSSTSCRRSSPPTTRSTRRSPALFDGVGTNVMASATRPTATPTPRSRAPTWWCGRGSTQQRMANVPLEGRAMPRALRPGHRRRSRSTSRTRTRTCSAVALATLLGLPPETVTVRCGDIGGSFGQKAYMSREEVAVCAAARLLGAPGEVGGGPHREPARGRPRARRPPRRGAGGRRPTARMLGAPRATWW